MMFESASALVVILSSAWFTLIPEPAPLTKETLVTSYMTDVRNSKWDLSLTKEKSVVDVAYQSKPTGFYGLRYGASAMVNGQGTFLIGPGVGKTIDVKGLDLSLFIYPSYSSIKGTDSIRSLSGHLNFRTTFDVLYRIDEKNKLGLGLMHVSNGGYKQPNMGLDAVRLVWATDF